MEVAALGLKADSSQIRDATIALKELPPAATAAERAAQRWGVTTTNAGRSAEDFSRRVQGTIRQLEFERQQLTRNAAEQQKYAALRRAGVTASSAEGQAIAAAVTALQAQRAAIKATTDAQKRSAEATRESLTMWRGYASALAGTVGVGAILRAADAYTALTNAIKVTGSDGAALAYVQDRLFATAARNGVQVDALGQLYSRTAMAGKELGISQEQLLEFVDGVTAALRVQGGSSEQASGALLQLSQALGSGTVRAEEFNSILEGALPIAQAAARGMDGMGGSVAKLRAAVLEGTVTSKAFFEATMKGFGETRRQAESASLTLGQAMTSLSNAFINYVGNVDKASGASAALARAISAIGKALTEANKDTQAGTGGLFTIPKVLESTVKEAEGIIAALDRVDLWLREFAARAKTYIGQKVDGFAVEGARGAAMFIEAFRAIPDGLGKLFVDGMNKAIAAVEAGIREITAKFADSWLGRRLGVTANDAPTMGRINGGGFSASDMTGRISGAGEAAANQVRQAQAARDLIARQAGMEGDEARARLGGMPSTGPLGFGGDTAATKKGGSDPYAKTIESAKEYILTKKAETEAIGQTVLAAAQLKHEQELLNKATGEGRVLSEAQKAALKDLAGQMAEADNSPAKAKFTDDAKTRSEEFLAQQQLERDSLFLSAEAANRLKLETEMLNAAKRQGIELSPAEVESIKATAEAMAASQEHTRRLSEQVGLAKDVTKGFFSDVSQGLREGASVWEAFGTAAENALNRIIDKLLEMAVDDLFNAAFGGGKSGGGGGGIFGSIFGGSGGSGGGIFDGILNLFGFARGGAFRAGNVIPFARGDVFSSPTYFPLSQGRTGVMGEAGPEAIMPLRRGPGGRLGVEVANTNRPQPVVVQVYANEGFVTALAKGAAVQVVNEAAPDIENRALKRANQSAPSVVANYENVTGGEYRFGRD
jgi:tape measure domain-containing protein